MITREALEALFVANPDFEAVEKSQDVFCPFEAVGMVRQEVRHGHFLAYCLDPHRPHGFGSECLRALMRSAAHAQENVPESGITPLDVHLMDFGKAQIRREWRKIDLLAIINEEKLIVAIELKIDSGEHSGQLRRYRDVVEKQWPAESGWKHIFIYLTKNGDDPSEEDGSGWISLELESLAGQLDSMVERQVGNSEANRLLRAYLAMLRRHHLTDEKMAELAEKLWSQHREALEFLADYRPDTDGGLFGQLFENREHIAERMTAASGLKIVADDSTRSKLLHFAVEDWDNLPGFKSDQNWTKSNRLMLFEFARGSKQRLHLRLVLGPGEQGIRQRYYQAMSDAGVPLSKRKEISARWTRLGSKSIAMGGDDEQEDSTDFFEKTIEGIEKYSRDMIPAYDKALSALKK